MIPDGEIRKLIAAAQAGNRDAADRLLELLRPHLERLAGAYADSTRADASVSDIVQEVSLRVWQGIGQFRGAATDSEAITMFRVWVERIVERTGLNAVRHRDSLKRSPEGRAVFSLNAAPKGSDSSSPDDPAASATTPSVAARRSERAVHVQAALARIDDPDERRLVALRFFDGLSLRAAAARLGITYDVARTRYEAAMRRLERELDGLK